MPRLQGILVGLVLGSVVTFTLPTFAQGPEERRLIEQWQAREEMRRQVALRQAEEARDKRQRGQADVRAREEMLRLQMQRQAEELKERMRRAQAAQAGQPREQQGDHPERKIDTLRQAAEFLERAGKHDAARQAREEAELIEHELLRRHREPDPGTEAVLREIRELREQMDHLQKDIRGLHERFRELTERLDSKPGGKSDVTKPSFPFRSKPGEQTEQREGRGPALREQLRRKINREGDGGLPEARIPSDKPEKKQPETAAGVSDVAEASGDTKTEKNAENAAAVDVGAEVEQ